MKEIVKKGIVSAVAAASMLTATAFPSTYSSLSLNDTSIIQTINAEAASVSVQRGCFNGNNWNSGTVVCVPNSRRSAKIKICAFMQNGRIKSGRYYVAVYGCDYNGNNCQYVDTYNKSGSSYIYLDSGYSYYKIFIKRRGTSSTNVSRTQYWSIDGTRNVSWLR